jgi:hypothetical protein
MYCQNQFFQLQNMQKFANKKKHHSKHWTAVNDQKLKSVTKIEEKGEKTTRVHKRITRHSNMYFPQIEYIDDFW